MGSHQSVNDGHGLEGRKQGQRCHQKSPRCVEENEEDWECSSGAEDGSS
jgi:hypothetical protein